MISTSGCWSALAVATATLAGTALPTHAAAQCCNVYELRQYTLHPGKRDVLIELFEREFIESQEAAGMVIHAQFRDLDNPDRFVWVRGFADMPSRATALEAFYTGPVWKANREAANATMIDSDNVLLLRPASREAGIALDAPRPPAGAKALPASVFVATVYYGQAPLEEGFSRWFQRDIAPVLAEAGARPVAWFENETASNTFPRLPVREGENAFVWFARFDDMAAYDASRARLSQSARWRTLETDLSAKLRRPPEIIRLAPTARSQWR